MLLHVLKSESNTLLLWVVVHKKSKERQNLISGHVWAKPLPTPGHSNGDLWQRNTPHWRHISVVLR